MVGRGGSNGARTDGLNSAFFSSCCGVHKNLLLGFLRGRSDWTVADMSGRNSAKWFTRPMNNLRSVKLAGVVNSLIALAFFSYAKIGFGKSWGIMANSWQWSNNISGVWMPSWIRIQVGHVRLPNLNVARNIARTGAISEPSAVKVIVSEGACSCCGGYLDSVLGPITMTSVPGSGIISKSLYSGWWVYRWVGASWCWRKMEN